MPIFVVQEHWARRHHFDLRLEVEGVLKSWAVPKDIPLEPGVRRLAVQVEDHPIEYADFSGRIPEGYYGAGEVIIFDRGEYELIEYSVNRIKFKLFGQKLSGVYQLIKFREEGGRVYWLLFKVKE
ncbi:MAG: DNA polymerase ligase N-terminal domain-containing protein [Nitrososphaeria archaeon]